MEDGASEAMPPLAAVELNQDASAIGLVVNGSQETERFGDTPKLGASAYQGPRSDCRSGWRA
jgi:hypothetical protein